MNKMINLISLSSGKDSTAMALWAIRNSKKNIKFIFCDTGNEHPLTYEYIKYLDEKLFALSGTHIEVLRQDFASRVLAKKERLVAAGEIERAQHTNPTGNPFVDLAILKGRFPSTQARFCTQELKVKPVLKRVRELLALGDNVANWSGVRAQESTRRAKLPETEVFMVDKITGCVATHYRPLLEWSWEDCFKIMREYNVEPNPLYKMGFSRVGCFPRIGCRKNELRNICLHHPDQVQKLRDWEAIVGPATKRHMSTFFPMVRGRDTLDNWLDWSKTDRKGNVLPDDFPIEDVYGLRKEPSQ